MKSSSRYVQFVGRISRLSKAKIITAYDLESGRITIVLFRAQPKLPSSDQNDGTATQEKGTP
jgi:hypothetical protein